MHNNENSDDQSNPSIQLNEENEHDAEFYIKKAGGWGRMQYLCFLFCFLSYHGPNFYAYNLAYLELVPRLLCGQKGQELHECGIENELGFLADNQKYKSEL